MQHASELQREFDRFVAEQAAKRVRGSRGKNDLKLAELQVTEEVRKHLPPFQQRLVDKLRGLGVTWMAIANWTGLTVGAATTRWHEKPTKISKKALPGVSVDEAAKKLGTHASTVRWRIGANPEAKWHTKVHVGGKRGDTTRILDLQALADAGRSPARKK